MDIKEYLNIQEKNKFEQNLKEVKNKPTKKLQMEKTVDDTLKNIDILLKNEVSKYFIYICIYFNIQHLDSEIFESLYKKLKHEKEKKEIFYLFMKTFDKLEEVSKYIFISNIYSSERR